MIFALFDTSGFAWTSVLMTVVFGAVFGAIWAFVGYSLTGGQRDFTSVTQVVATKYEVLTEHKHAARGREAHRADGPDGGGSGGGAAAPGAGPPHRPDHRSRVDALTASRRTRVGGSRPGLA